MHFLDPSVNFLLGFPGTEKPVESVLLIDHRRKVINVVLLVVDLHQITLYLFPLDSVGFKLLIASPDEVPELATSSLFLLHRHAEVVILEYPPSLSVLFQPYSKTFLDELMKESISLLSSWRKKSLADRRSIGSL